MLNYLKSKKELLIIFVLSIIFLIVLLYFRTNITKVYASKELSGILLSVFGMFLGFVLTAYTIFVGLNQHVTKKFKATEAYNKINVRFALTLFLLIFILIIGLLNFFVFSDYLILGHLLLIGLSIFLIILLVSYIFLLFRIVK